MRLTVYADYSLRLLMYLALKEDGCATIGEVAKAYGISKRHLQEPSDEGCPSARGGGLHSDRARQGWRTTAWQGCTGDRPGRGCPLRRTRHGAGGLLLAGKRVLSDRPELCLAESFGGRARGVLGRARRLHARGPCAAGRRASGLAVHADR